MKWIDWVLLGGLIVHSIRLLFIDRAIRRMEKALQNFLFNLPHAADSTIDIKIRMHESRFHGAGK